MNLQNVTKKLIGLGLMSTLLLSSCNNQIFPSKSQSNNNQITNTEKKNSQINIQSELTNKLENLQLNFTNFRTEVDRLNENLAKIAKKQIKQESVNFVKVNQSSEKLNRAINDLQIIIENNPVKNQLILKQNLVEIETFLASINKVIKPLNNGLGKPQVTQVQKYLNFFPKRGLSSSLYGNFGQITQIEIAKFLNQKNQNISQNLTSLDSNILAKNTSVIEVPSTSANNNNLETITEGEKIINLEQKQKKLQQDFNNFTDDIKKSLFALIVIFFIFILLTSIVLILVIYKPMSSNYEQETNQKKYNFKQIFSEYQSKFQKQDQQINQINQYLNQFEGQFKQVSQYINQIEQILIKQMNQRLVNLENSQKINLTHTNLISSNVNPNLAKGSNLLNPVPTINLSKLEITSEEQLLENYNSNQFNLLIPQVVLLAETLNTMKKRREGKDVIPIFEINKSGDFWLINIQNKYYLLPRNDFQLNEFSYKVLTVVFSCNNDQLKFTKFKVIKPAEVIKTNQGWELKELGELHFY